MKDLFQNLFRKKDIAAILREAESTNGGLRRTLTAPLQPTTGHIMYAHLIYPLSA